MTEKKISFTQAYKSFEKISEEIENNQDLSIEEQLEKIEEATKLYKICIKYLEETKNKIIAVNKNIDDVEL
jgi:exodeoxyribonuclease VII small subunit